MGRYPLNRLLMTSQKPIVIPDTRANDLWVPSPAHTQEIRSWIGAPLVVKGESIGVLAAHSLTPNAYDERDGIIVFAFASQAAEAIDKVRLLDQAQNRLHAMMALYEASLDVLGHSPEPERLLHTLMRRAVDLLRADAGGIYLVDPDRVTLRLAITHGFVDAYRGVGIKIGDGVVGRVFQIEPAADRQRLSALAGQDAALQRRYAFLGDAGCSPALGKRCAGRAGNLRQRFRAAVRRGRSLAGRVVCQPGLHGDEQRAPDRAEPPPPGRAVGAARRRACR